MLNLPMTDTFAVRLNASWTDEAGFIDQPDLYVLNASGVPVAAQPGNLSQPSAGILFQGRDQFLRIYRNARSPRYSSRARSSKPSCRTHYQVSSGDGLPWAIASVRARVRCPRPTTSRTRLTDRVDLFALTLEADLGFATLTSNTSWSHLSTSRYPI